MFIFFTNTITCRKCSEKTSREELKLDRAFKNEMQTLPIICTLCYWSGILKTYTDHRIQTMFIVEKNK